MTPTIVGLLICASPLLFTAAGYYVGRYGSPIVLRRQPRRDRRQPRQVEEEPEEVEVFRSERNHV